MLPYVADAAHVRIRTYVGRTRANARQTYGGCMVLIQQNPAEFGLECRSSRWVSLGCDSDQISKEGGERMRNDALIAAMTGNQIMIWVTDTVQHNGFCTAFQVDILDLLPKNNSLAQSSSDNMDEPFLEEPFLEEPIE